MGCRLTDKLHKSKQSHELLLVEVSDAGNRNIAERGLTTTDEATALDQAEVVILALPDRVLGKVAQSVVPRVNPGTIVVTLDPAPTHVDAGPIRFLVVIAPRKSFFGRHCHGQG